MEFYQKIRVFDMKLYVKAATDKPVLDDVNTIWREFGDESGIVFTVLSSDNNILFEEVFDYDDVDPDAIYDSGIELAILALSQKYELTDEAIRHIKEIQ